MAKTLYLIDGMGFAFRSFFAIRAGLTDAKGRPSNAVYGFARMLLKLLRIQQPTHVAVVFDAPGKTFRDDLYAAYKANRPEAPEDFKIQLPLIHDLVDALALPKLIVGGVEADDVMGTLAKRGVAEGYDVVLVTADKDMLQCIEPGVRVFDPGKTEEGVWLGEEAVRERFGTDPAHVVDALALIGDTADHVPGVRGIGDKTAKKLLEKYGSLEGLYDHIDELKGKQRENLEHDRDQAFLSRELVTIKTDVAVDTRLESLALVEPEREPLLEFLLGMRFQSLIDELLPELDEPDPEATADYATVLFEDDLQHVVAAIRKAGQCAIDTETTSTHPMLAELVGISLSWAPGKAVYIPVAHMPHLMDAAREGAEAQGSTPLDPASIRDTLRPILEDPTLPKIGHNIKYDLIVLSRAGYPLAGPLIDTMVASYLTDPGRLRHNLNELSLQYFRRKLTPISSLIGAGSRAITFDCVPVDQATGYACEDADMAWRLWEHFEPELAERALDRLFFDVELPLIRVLAAVESAGVKIDIHAFDALREEMQARLGVLETEIHTLAGEPFVINSPKQLQRILFETLGLKPKRRTKTGYSTDVDVLEALAAEHPLPERVLAYRTLEKLRGTYVDALPKLVHPATGRIHTSFNQAVAATGRLSSSDPNLQNIPVRTEYGKRIREAFVPEDDSWRLISADYSQIELRILAHLSADAALREAFERGEDIHRDTAARVFGVAPDAVGADQRRQAKAVNFGVVYGISAFGLARNLGIGRDEAARFIDAYFEQYPGVRKWLDDTTEQAKQDGFVVTVLQRRRYLPDLKSSDANVRKGAERAAINTPVQGSAADIIKLAMLRLDAKLGAWGSRMLLQVHDELVVEAPEVHAEAVAACMRETMENALPLSVALKVDVGIGTNWAAIH